MGVQWRLVDRRFSFSLLERIFIWEERSNRGERETVLDMEQRQGGCVLLNNNGRRYIRSRVEVGWRQMHSLALRLKMLALVHGQATSSTTETIALRTEFAAVADFAKQLALVLGTVCRVEHFAAKTCNTRSLLVVGYYGLSCDGIVRVSKRDVKCQLFQKSLA